jgi:hypothetical protein
VWKQRATAAIKQGQQYYWRKSIYLSLFCGATGSIVGAAGGWEVARRSGLISSSLVGTGALVGALTYGGLQVGIALPFVPCLLTNVLWVLPFGVLVLTPPVVIGYYAAGLYVPKTD